MELLLLLLAIPALLHKGVLQATHRQFIFTVCAELYIIHGRCGDWGIVERPRQQIIHLAQCSFGGSICFAGVANRSGPFSKPMTV
jgi:hypothetical protein